MAWTDTGLKTCSLPAVLTLKPLGEEIEEFRHVNYGIICDYIEMHKKAAG